MMCRGIRVGGSDLAKQSWWRKVGACECDGMATVRKNVTVHLIRVLGMFEENNRPHLLHALLPPFLPLTRCIGLRATLVALALVDYALIVSTAFSSISTPPFLLSSPKSTGPRVPTIVDRRCRDRGTGHGSKWTGSDVERLRTIHDTSPHPLPSNVGIGVYQDAWHRWIGVAWNGLVPFPAFFVPTTLRDPSFVPTGEFLLRTSEGWGGGVCAPSSLDRTGERWWERETGWDGLEGPLPMASRGEGRGVGGEPSSCTPLEEHLSPQIPPLDVNSTARKGPRGWRSRSRRLTFLGRASLWLGRFGRGGCIWCEVVQLHPPRVGSHRVGLVRFAKHRSRKQSTRSRKAAVGDRVHAMEGGVRFLCTGEKLGLHPERHRGPSDSSLATLGRGEDWDAGHALDGRNGHANVEIDLGRAMRRVSSAPTLKSLGSTSGGAGQQRPNVCSEMEVYVVHRPLREFGGPAFQTLPDFVKHTLRDLGICHYMTIFRTPDGEMRQFDFGPIGGDISLKGKLPGHKRRMREKRGAQGEIREDVIDVFSLPEDCMFVGRTRLTLDDIRTFNLVQNSVYLLNQNDCRHYCNNLVKYSTGLEKVTSVMLTSTVSEKRKARKNVHEKVLDPFIFACHYMTDCTNWKTVSRVRDCTVTVACTVLGVKAFPERLSGPLMKVLPAKQVLPLIGAAAGKPFRNATITAFAAAAASYSEGLVSAPLIRETVSLGTKIGDGLKATAHVAETIVAMGLNTSVSSFTMASSGAVTVASEAASSAAKYAGTASRGAVKAFGLGMRKSSSGVSLPRLSKSARAAIGRPLAVSLTQRQS